MEPLGASNPFTKDERKKVFNQALETLSKISFNPDWIWREAMKLARRVSVPKKPRPARAKKAEAGHE
jgi:hypothetical protein